MSIKLDPLVKKKNWDCNFNLKINGKDIGIYVEITETVFFLTSKYSRNLINTSATINYKTHQNSGKLEVFLSSTKMKTSL